VVPVAVDPAITVGAVVEAESARIAAPADPSVEAAGAKL
jgi:hypothetical protein